MPTDEPVPQTEKVEAGKKEEKTAEEAGELPRVEGEKKNGSNQDNNNEKTAYTNLLRLIQFMQKDLKDIKQKATYNENKFIGNSYTKYSNDILNILTSFKKRDERREPIKIITQYLNKTGTKKEPNKIALSMLALERGKGEKTMERMIWPKKQQKNLPH